MLFFFANVNYAAVEETWSSVSGDAGEGTLGVVLADTSPCHSPFETQYRQLSQGVASVASGGGASDTPTELCNHKMKKLTSCPVQCFRADPVCGTDNITYWCGAADAKCAGVEVAHDGYCNVWELDANVGSTTAVRAAQSLQLVHMLWLVVAGLLIVLGSV